MTSSEKDFCFCTLALGSPYRVMAKELAEDLKTYAKGTYLVVGTDAPEDFTEYSNIIPFKHIQQGILHCYNDRRFAIKEGLKRFNTAIHIDADTRITGFIPEDLQFFPGLGGGFRNLVAHVTKYRPEDLEILKKVSAKLSIPIEDSNWVGESLYMVTKDNGHEQEFLDIWELLANYLELKKMHSGDGHIMGLSATKVGWTVKTPESWELIRQVTKHLDASYRRKEKTALQKLQFKLKYFYRLSKARLNTLKDIDFYYL